MKNLAEIMGVPNQVVETMRLWILLNTVTFFLFVVAATLFLGVESTPGDTLAYLMLLGLWVMMGMSELRKIRRLIPVR
ncbi:MAG: hypothetical protein A3D67_01475 [Candidatus Lloydbacteria bacterium RIFCSPHIGHO2_02_FULL_51_22]|uniref:Uncharacterized protein n=1 Tax=Candidatus Lloydbacteria bacterium RIFCSPHIGHO2_02_FULL_51_22 TaxID=1798663 RepID=A0A1G2D5K6_9BACT|nr:MAG: hypothetical protein A3D67_01475 [Candidatus Lloydbacteria bacterium RIFCSPHIGHO2_02_FULL_51_22]